MTVNQGSIISIRGSVVDVRFLEHLPALRRKIKSGEKLTEGDKPNGQGVNPYRRLSNASASAPSAVAERD